jgi:hypothetical protein
VFGLSLGFYDLLTLGLFSRCDFAERRIRDIAMGELPKRREAQLPQVIDPFVVSGRPS